MSDKVASNFSFRMFDLYRRFVEVLQLFPDYLQEFKTGFPQEEICHNIIKQVFKYPQTNDKILQLTKYLSKNSKTIAAHAEDVPVNWKDAIKYTETCIKLVRRYLKKKGINVKDDIDSLNDIATEIGEYLHINPNEKQIEAIKDFLKHDIENPKNTIASPIIKKLRNKTNKIIKPTDVVENADIAEIKRNSLKMVIKRMNGDSTQMQTENSSSNDPLSIEVESLTNEKSFTQNQKQSYEISLENEFEKKSNQEVATADDQEKYKRYSQGEELDSVRPDDSQDIKYLLSDSMKPYCPEDEYIIIEFNDQTKDPLLHGVEQQSDISSISLIPDKNLSQKRKSSISLNDDPDCIKKLFLSDVSLTDTQNDQYVTISYNGINEEQNHKSVHESFLDKADDTYKNDHDSSNSEIIIVDNCYDDELTPNENFYINKQIDNKSSSYKKNVSYSHNELLQDKKEEYIVKDESKYSDVLNMSYAKALELMETIMCFCESRNEVSLEEFLVLRRTRDKIHWRSLKEINKENL